MEGKDESGNRKSNLNLPRGSGRSIRNVMSIRNFTSVLVGLLISGVTLAARGADNPFVGQWELTIPGGAAGWLGVEEKNGRIEASVLWGSGSVLPVESAKVEGDHLLLTRKYQIERTNAAGKKSKVNLVETI